MIRWVVVGLVLGGCGRLEFDDATQLAQMSVRGDHGCGVSRAGEIGCWGANYAGQLGFGTVGGGSIARRVRTTRHADEVITGEYTSCLLSEGVLECWGDNQEGKVAPSLPAVVPLPSRIDLGVDVAGIELGQWGSVARGTDGLVRYFGGNGCGQAGTGSVGGSVPPTLIPGLGGVTDLAISDAMTCALVGDGTIWCWGVVLPAEPQTNACPETPVAPQQLFAPPSPVVDLDGGCHQHICAALADGTVWCLGVNYDGQLGTGTLDNAATFTQVIGVSDATQVAVGAFHTCALRTGGEVVCWGRDDLGALGRGTFTEEPVPLVGAVIGLPGPVDEIEASCGSTCARQGGELYCWGENAMLELGTGSLGDSAVPVVSWHGPDPLGLD